MHTFKTLAVLGLCGAIVAAVLYFAFASGTPEQAVDTTSQPAASTRTTDTATASAQVANTNQTKTMNNPIAIFNTNHGAFEVELYEDVMPTTAGNFRKLAEDGYFDGTKFHRVVEGFMIQGGDPLTKDDSKSMYWGTGGPGYAIPDEFVDDERLTNTPGTISMANSGPNTGGSQFFVNTGDNSAFLDGRHPVFGRVVSGMDVVTAISGVPVEMQPMGGEQSRPVEPIVIDSVTIRTEK